MMQTKKITCSLRSHYERYQQMIEKLSTACIFSTLEQNY